MHAMLLEWSATAARTASELLYGSVIVSTVRFGGTPALSGHAERRHA